MLPKDCRAALLAFAKFAVAIVFGLEKPADADSAATAEKVDSEF
jgi:hypothetical protein